MLGYCYVNGEIKTVAESSIGITDLALQRGYGVFDYICTFNGSLFHFHDHYERFKFSASELSMLLPLSKSEMKKIGMQLLEMSELDNPALRMILTGGYSNIKPLLSIPNLIMIAEELPVYPHEVYTNGAKLIMVNYQRELPHVKTINYLNTFRLNKLKKEKDAFDVLYYSDNGVAECPRNNFFIIKNNELITPKEFVLFGITRKIILELARECFTIEERKIKLEELKDANEAFITSTTGGIIPITQIDEHKIGNGIVGDKTKNIMKLFDKYTKNYLD